MNKCRKKKKKKIIEMTILKKETLYLFYLLFCFTFIYTIMSLQIFFVVNFVTFIRYDRLDNQICILLLYARGCHVL